MASIAVAIRYSSNLAELSNNLKQGINQVEALSSSADKMADRLGGSKMIQSAHNLVAAIDKVGISTLTTAQASSSLQQLERALEKLHATGKPIPPAMQSTADALRKMVAEADNGPPKLDGLTTKMVALGTAAGTFLGRMAYDAVRSLGSEIVEIAKRGVTLAPVVSSFEALTRSVGASGDRMIATSRTATKGLISDLDLMASANKAINLGLPVTDANFAQLAEGAVTVGRAMKLGPVQSINDLIEGLGKGSPEVLNNLGIIVKADDAYKAYAASIDKTVQELSASDKQHAMYEAGISSLMQKVEALGGIQLTLADRVTQVKVRVGNVTDALGVAIARSPAINAAFDAMASALDTAFGTEHQDQVKRVAGWIDAAAISGVSFGQALVLGARVVVGAFNGLELVIKTLMLAIVGIGEVTVKSFLMTISAAAQIPGIGGKFEPLKRALQDTAWQAEGMRKSLQDQVSEAWEGVKGNSALGRTLEATGRALADAKAKMLTATAASVAHAEVTDTVTTATNQAGAAAGKLGADYDKLQVKGLKVVSTTDSIATALKAVKSVAIGLPPLAPVMTLPSANVTAADVLKWQESLREKTDAAGETTAKSFSSRFGTLLTTELPKTIMDAIKGGGDPIAAAGSLVGTWLVGEHGIGKQLNAAVPQLFGEKLGGLITKALPGLGAMVGPALSGLFNKLFGSAGRDAVVKFAESMGGFSDLRSKLIPLGDEGERLWKNLTQGVGKNNPAQAKAAIEAITEALAAQDRVLQQYGQNWDTLPAAMRARQLSDEIRTLTDDHRVLVQLGWSGEEATRAQADAYNDLLAKVLSVGSEIPPALMPMLSQMADLGLVTEANMRAMLGLTATTLPDFKAMEEAAGRYGIALGDLGPKFQQAKLNDLFGNLLKDFNLLSDGGANMAVVIEKMGPQVNSAVQQAIKFGAEIPASMRPMIEAMARAGQLVDENGVKMTDLGGLKWATPIEDSMKELVRLFKELINHMTGAKDAANKIPSRVTVDVEFRAGRVPTFDAAQVHAEAAHSGAMVTAAGIRRFHSGTARVLPFPGLASDEVPAILQTGEAVLRREAVDALGSDAVAALNGLSGSIGRSGGGVAAGSADGELRGLRADLQRMAAEQATDRAALAVLLPKAVASAIRKAVA